MEGWCRKSIWNTWKPTFYVLTVFCYFSCQRAINEAATDWGLKCLRYEISMSFFFASSLSYGEGHQFLYFSCFEIDDTGDISPPHGVKVAMEMQVEAERRKRAQILEAEGKKRAQILESEGIDYTTFFIWRLICGSNSSSGKRIIWWQFNLQIHSKCFSFDVTCMQEQVMML